MRNDLIGTLLAVSLASGAVAGDSIDNPSAEQPWGMLKQYCTDCHNAVDWAGGVAFDTMSPDTVAEDGRVWEAALRKLRVRLMPPPDKPQPSQEQLAQLTDWLQIRLDQSQSTPRSAYVPVQRLNRTEYANAIRTLLGVEIKVKDLLPPEIEVGGFDKVAAALNVSPGQGDCHTRSARQGRCRCECAHSGYQ